MKRYVKCDSSNLSNTKFILSSGSVDSYEDEYADDLESEMTFYDWYDSDICMDDQNKFIDILESKVRSEYDVSEWFDEPSVQGLMGADNILITLSSGDIYSCSFDFREELETIYTEGPEAAANYYFKQIKEEIDSGSALVPDTTTTL